MLTGDQCAHAQDDDCDDYRGDYGIPVAEVTGCSVFETTFIDNVIKSPDRNDGPVPDAPHQISRRDVITSVAKLGSVCQQPKERYPEHDEPPKLGKKIAHL